MPNDFFPDYYQWAESSITSTYRAGGINYSTVSVDEIINGFLISYVGEDKIIRKADRTEVGFFAQRGIQEFTYDILPSLKAFEFKVPNTLTWSLPKDYVNYSKLYSYDDKGLERVIYPERKSGDAFSIDQLENGQPKFDYGTSGDDNIDLGPDGRRDATAFTPRSEVIASCTLRAIPGVTSVNNPRYRLLTFTTGAHTDLFPGITLRIDANNINEYYSNVRRGFAGVIDIDTRDVNIFGGEMRPVVLLNKYIGGEGDGEAVFDTVEFVKHESEQWKKFKGNNSSSNTTTYDPTTDNDLTDVFGRRYGLNPERTQVNGTFYINSQQNRLHFSSGLAGEFVTLEYISDGMSNGFEARVHKYAEEALYKHIQYQLASNRSYVPQGTKLLLKKEAKASRRNAKIRLQNYRIEEFAQIMRNKNKRIKN